MFAHNHFGAYTHEAQGMRWSGNTFSDNEEYGFDPHDFSDDFVVENNTAHHNGKHGFIFSRGCLRNVLRGNTAYANTGHGFMIDDGRSTASATAEARIDPSNDNLVTGNVAHDNAGSGVEIEGGTGNVVADNHLSRNHIEVRVKDGATASVTGNQIDGSEAFATITNQQPSMARTPGRAGTSVNSTSTQTARGASASWRLCPTGTKRSASPWAM